LIFEIFKPPFRGIWENPFMASIGNFCGNITSINKDFMPSVIIRIPSVIDDAFGFTNKKRIPSVIDDAFGFTNKRCHFSSVDLSKNINPVGAPNPRIKAPIGGVCGGGSLNIGAGGFAFGFGLIGAGVGWGSVNFALSPLAWGGGPKLANLIPPATAPTITIAVTAVKIFIFAQR
jgi:hypothetical protein